jgi:transcriptional regulator
MYVPDSYRAPNPEAAVEIIAANPWAVLVSCTDEAPLASHIPVILDCEGEPGATLLGHLARANPHSRLLSRRGRFSRPKLVTIGPELGPEQA